MTGRALHGRTPIAIAIPAPRWFAALSLAAFLVGACGEESETEATCGVGEFCPCLVDADCPDIVLESCVASVGICSARTAEPDVGDADVSADSGADVAVDTVDATDAPSDVVELDTGPATVEEATLAATTTCSRACGVCPESTPETCGEYCATIVADAQIGSDNRIACLIALEGALDCYAASGVCFDSDEAGSVCADESATAGQACPAAGE